MHLEMSLFTLNFDRQKLHHDANTGKIFASDTKYQLQETGAITIDITQCLSDESKGMMSKCNGEPLKTHNIRQDSYI